jgi:membrane protease subunit HflK
MAWNKPGGDNNNHDPWGGGQKNQNPPDLDKILTEFVKRLRSLLHLKLKDQNNWQPSSASKEYKFGIGAVALIVLLVWFLSGLYIVNPAEQAVILRLGKFSETQTPGLHWMARFVDSKYLVDVQKINSFSLEGDFLTKSSEQNDVPNALASTSAIKPAVVIPGNESSDKSKNLVNVELTVQYRISDPRAYLFNVLDPDNTIQEVASGALSDIVGKMKLDDVLTTGRELLSAQVLERTKDVLNTYHSGLDVVAVTLRKVQAPDQVQEAFNDVNRAEQDKATYIQQAQAYASKVVPLAQGVAARILADANAYQQQSVLTAQAQIAKYQALLTVYKISPDIMRERMYLETMQSVFQNTSKVLLDSNTGNNIVYLPIDKMVQSVKQSDTASPDGFRLNATTNQSTGTEVR